MRLNIWFYVALLLIFITPFASADSIPWNDTKNVTVQSVTLESAKEFTTCSIDPNNQWDNCTAYIIIKNNGSVNITLANLDFSHNWSKPAWVRNFDIDFTKNMSYQNITTSRQRRGNFTNTTQRYLNASNFVNYSIAKSGTLFRNQSAVAKISFQKKTWQRVHFNFTGKYNALSILLDPDVSACGTLNSDGATYNLLNNVSSNSDCFTITANNISFEGNNFYIQHGNVSFGSGFKINGRSNISLQNITIFQNNSVYIGGYGIDLINSNNVNISNIIIYDFDDYGLYIDTNNLVNLSNINITDSNYATSDRIEMFSVTNSTLNNISLSCIDISINPYGIYTNSRDSFNIYNSVSVTNCYGGLIINNNGIYNNLNVSYNTGYDIWSAASNNVFNNINLSSLFRRVFLKYTTTYFNISGNNLKLNTSLSVSDSYFDRQVFSWTKDNLTWNDNNATGGITAYYNLSNLHSNRNYSIYNNSILHHNDTTDGSGTLPQFSINLSNPITEIKVLAESLPSGATSYIPPTPINCISVNGTTWINVSCSAGVGNITNGMNFTNTNTSAWSNGTSFLWNNSGLVEGTTYMYHIWAWNNSVGNLSSTYTIVSNTTLISPPPPPIPYNLTGYVNNSLALPIQNAKVEDGSSIFTDVNGYYHLENVTNGSTILVRAIGYQNKTQTLNISSDSMINFTLSPSVSYSVSAPGFVSPIILISIIISYMILRRLEP